MNPETSKIDQEMLLGFLAERRSTRRFQDRDLSPETLQALVATAAHIPSGGNRHAHGFIVITRNETRARMMKDLVRIYRRRSRLLNSAFLRTLLRPFVDPVTRGFLKDREYAGRMRALIGKLDAGEDPIFYGAPAAIVIHSPVPIPTPKEDCVIAGFVISLAAEAMGLGACFVTLGQNAINASARCRVILGLSPSERVHAVVVVGFPAATEKGPARRPAKEIRYA
jgi:nitroreductase